MSEPIFSIIIVNYRSEQFLQKCLASLFSCLSGNNFEIVIVNNDQKELLDEIRKNFPTVKIIQQQKNTGFGVANNIGAQKACGKYLWFLNPDTEISGDVLQKTESSFQQQEEVAIIGPRLLTPTGETQSWCAGKESNLWRNIKNNFGFVESKKIWESKEAIFADWVSGAAMFIRRDIFQKNGGFDENFFMYFEDEDLCRRIRRAGYKVLYYPKLTVGHLGGQSRKNIIKQKVQFFKSMVYYFRKK